MESFKDIISSGQIVLVDFFATWCGPCKSMHPILKELKERLGNDIRIIEIDVDKNQNLSVKYNIQAVPTFALFRKNEILWRQSGAMSLPNLMNVIKSYM